MNASDKAYKNARRFRRELSLPENLLWARIRRGKLHFRRQHPIGEYVLDFLLPGSEARDRGRGRRAFGDRPQRDERRTQWLKREGIGVLRIPAKDVLRDPDTIADAVIRLCTDGRKPLHHSASLSGPPPHARGAGRNED